METALFGIPNLGIFVDLAILAAEKVINQSLDKKAHQRLIEEVLEESTTPGEG